MEVDYNKLTTTELNALIVKLIDIRSTKITKQGSTGVGIVRDKLCAAMVNEKGGIQPWSVQTTIEQCCEESNRKLVAGIRAHLNEGCYIAQCYIVPVKLYSHQELKPFLSNVPR